MNRIVLIAPAGPGWGGEYGAEGEALGKPEDGAGGLRVACTEARYVRQTGLGTKRQAWGSEAKRAALQPS